MHLRPFALEDFEQIAVLTEDACAIVGFCILESREVQDSSLLVSNRKAHMESLFVREDFRKMGIGTMLYTHAADKAKELGIVRIELSVWTFNKSANSFYEKIGFQPQRTIMEIPMDNCFST